MASAGDKLEGELTLNELPRVYNLLIDPDDPAQNLHFSLSFKLDAQGRCLADGVLQVPVQLQCQRCLQPMGCLLEAEPHYEFVGSNSDPAQVLKEREPVAADDDVVDLIMLIEDEVLLSLPAAPLHEPEQCSADSGYQTADSPPGETLEKGNNPFAKLKDLN